MSLVATYVLLLINDNMYLPEPENILGSYGVDIIYFKIFSLLLCL